MRVTNSLMSNTYLRNLNSQSTKVYELQNQLASLQEVSKPSDDPITVSQIMDLNNSISQNEEYLSTIEDAMDWSNVQDSALEQATNSMANIRTLIQSAANGTMTTDDREAIKNNIQAEVESMVDSLNTNFGGRYVFGGQNTTTKPFDLSEDGVITYNGTNDSLSREVSPGVSVDLLTDGSEILVVEGEDSFNTFLKEVYTALDTEGSEETLSGLLDEADNHFNTIVDKRAENGSIYNRLDAAKSRNESENLNLQTMRSNKQDVDLAEKYMEFSMEMVAYQASLQVGTQILQNNILNYL